MKYYRTPEGFGDVYSEEAGAKDLLEAKIQEAFRLFDYSPVETPTLEYFDVYRKERGSVSSADMFKLFDRNGETLVLRPDITPSIARAVSLLLLEKREKHCLWYRGNTFTNEQSHRGYTKEMTELGAECIGEGGLFEDAELLALLAFALEEAGLNACQIFVGSMSFFRSLLKECNLSDKEEELRTLMEKKNLFGMEDLLRTMEEEDPRKTLLLTLPERTGGREFLEAVLPLLKEEETKKEIIYLMDLYDLLSEYGFSDRISFDLSLLGKYRYYTGIVFRAFTYEAREAIALGGRYDSLLQQFGTDAPAIGFSIRVNTLMNAMMRQGLLKPPGKPIISQNPVEAMNLRKKGIRVRLKKGGRP